MEVLLSSPPLPPPSQHTKDTFVFCPLPITPLPFPLAAQYRKTWICVHVLGRVHHVVGTHRCNFHFQAVIGDSKKKLTNIDLSMLKLHCRSPPPSLPPPTQPNPVSVSVGQKRLVQDSWGEGSEEKEEEEGFFLDGHKNFVLRLRGGSSSSTTKQGERGRRRRRRRKTFQAAFFSKGEIF